VRTVGLVCLISRAEGEKSETSGTGATRGGFVWLAGPANPPDEVKKPNESDEQALWDGGRELQVFCA